MFNKWLQLGSDRSQLVFKMSDLPKVSRIDYPDAFYETTKDDLVHVLNDLRKQQVDPNEQMLLTRQMRDKKRRERMMRYKSTVIRVCFPVDRLVFQAVFKPTDTVRDVMQTLSDYLTIQDFYLYTVPPKRHLKPESTLFDAELVPAALIHFGVESAVSNQSAFKDQFKCKLSSYKMAAKIAVDARKANIATVSSSDDQSEGAVAAPTGQSTVQPVNTKAHDNSAGQRENKIPKWFKTNK